LLNSHLDRKFVTKSGKLGELKWCSGDNCLCSFIE